DGDDPLPLRDEARDDVEEGRLAGPRAAGDDDVRPRVHAGLEEPEAAFGAGSEADEVVDLVRVGGELADGQRGPVDGDRPQDRIDAGAVHEPAVHQRGPLVHAASHRAGYELDGGDQGLLVGEAEPGLRYPAVDLDED